MTLNSDQIRFLIQAVSKTTPDSLDCDGCQTKVAQFAETELAGKTLCESMTAVRNHMQNCPCCEDEYSALLEALKEEAEDCS